MDYQKILEDIYTEVKPYRRAGHQADYIPALERVNPDQFGMSLTTVDGRSFHVAESEVRFSIQSISKVYSLALCLSLRGEKLWERVGKEPSGNAFNSIVQLEYEDGIPRNPFINAGALVTADILVSCLEYPEGDFLRFVRALAGDDSIGANPEVAESEYLTSHLNQSIAHMLKYHGNLENEVDRVIRFYLMMCSVEMNCRQLAQSFLPFATTPSTIAAMSSLPPSCVVSMPSCRLVASMMRLASLPIWSAFLARVAWEVASRPSIRATMPWPYGARDSTRRATPSWE